MIKRRLSKAEAKLLPVMAYQMFALFNKHDKQIYLVGGAVRSLLARFAPINCDFTTDATPEEIVDYLAPFDPFYDNPYGTVAFSFTNEGGEKEIYEITPFRTESGYSDRRRPDQVSWGKDLSEDLKRRDFTINAIVAGPQEGDLILLDQFCGLADLENKIIRAVGDPDKRFAEDALRMMRAVRFASQLGLTIEPKTLEGIKTNFQLLKAISQERIRDELFKILTSPQPAEGVALLVETNLIKFILPELLDTVGVTQTGHHTMDVYDHSLESLRQCPASDPLIRLAVLLHDIGKPKTRKWRCKRCHHKLNVENIITKTDEPLSTIIKCPTCGQEQTQHTSTTFYGHEVVGARMAKEICQRLRLSNKQTEKLVTLVRWHMFNYDSEMTDAAIRRFIHRVGKENINDMMLLRISDRKGGLAKATSWRLQEMQKRIGEQLFEPMTVSDMAVNGHDLMKKFSIKPGPVLGKVLKQLFEEVLDDTKRNNKEYLLKRAKELLSAGKTAKSENRKV